MRTRLPLFLLLAGCATPVAPAASALQAVPHSATPAAADAARPAQASVAPPTASGDMIFDAWASDFQGRALAAGIDPAVFRREMAGLTPDPRIAALDSRQPEFSKPIGDYLKGVVTADRVTIGQRRRADVAEFGAIESRYGVPRDILIGIWALESGYGSIQGDNDVLRSLATLAAQGRRRAWAEGEMIATLRIIQSGEHPRSRLKGSWAGAMGQTQFIPSTYLATAVDQDGDGRRDIWGSRADALASAANLLAKAGWTRGQGWAREVTVPAGFDFGLTEGPRETPAWWADRACGRPTGGRGRRRTRRPRPSWWRRRAGGRCSCCCPTTSSCASTTTAWPIPWAWACWPTAWAAGPGWCALAGGDAAQPRGPHDGPAGAGGPGLRSGRAGRGGRHGHRRALREWQKARGLTADGYLSGDMVRRLRDEAAAKPAR